MSYWNGRFVLAQSKKSHREASCRPGCMDGSDCWRNVGRELGGDGFRGVSNLIGTLISWAFSWGFLFTLIRWAFSCGCFGSADRSCSRTFYRRRYRRERRGSFAWLRRGCSARLRRGCFARLNRGRRSVFFHHHHILILLLLLLLLLSRFGRRFGRRFGNRWGGHHHHIHILLLLLHLLHGLFQQPLIRYAFLSSSRVASNITDANRVVKSKLVR